MRIAALALSMLLAVTLASGCSSFGSSQSQSPPQPTRPPTRLAQILETGALRVGMSGEQPPLNMTAKNGEILGLAVALARALGAAMGVRTEIVRIPFPKLLDALEAGEIDLIMSGMTITAQRNLRVVFVGPYFVSGQSLLSKSTDLLAASVDELNNPKIKLAALTSSTSEAWVRSALPAATLVPTQSLDAGIQLVIDDKVDALVADQEVNYFAMLRHPQAGLATKAEPFTVEPIGIALPPDDHQLSNLISNYLGALEMQGVLLRARAYWFEDETWVEGLK
jgi:polar amino acid transport system substrate-binding protein